MLKSLVSLANLSTCSPYPTFSSLSTFSSNVVPVMSVQFVHITGTTDMMSIARDESKSLLVLSFCVKSPVENTSNVTILNF
jgi:hypothetical protein